MDLPEGISNLVAMIDHTEREIKKEKSTERTEELTKIILMQAKKIVELTAKRNAAKRNAAKRNAAIQRDGPRGAFGSFTHKIFLRY